jgi:hypothetical protein
MKHSHYGFLGDREYSFTLTAPLVLELERCTNTGIGALCERVFKRQFSQSDLSETIRLALIGGGETPKRAAELIASYVTDRPITEFYPIARDILLARWLGNGDASNG